MCASWCIFHLRQALDLFFISLHSLKLYASHYTQCTETAYFRCRHYTQYYQASIFFSFHYKPYNLCTSHYNQPFKTIPFSCVYLIIPFHFRFFFIVLHPSIIQRTHLRCTYLTSTCYFMNFGVISFPHSIAKFLLYQTHLKPTLFTCGPPMLLCRDKKGTRLPWIWQDWQ